MRDYDKPSKEADDTRSEDNEDADAQELADGTDATQQQTPQSWNCPACTYLNDSLRLDCELCGT